MPSVLQQILQDHRAEQRRKREQVNIFVGVIERQTFGDQGDGWEKSHVFAQLMPYLHELRSPDHYTSEKIWAPRGDEIQDLRKAFSKCGNRRSSSHDPFFIYGSYYGENTSTTKTDYKMNGKVSELPTRAYNNPSSSSTPEALCRRYMEIVHQILFRKSKAENVSPEMQLHFEQQLRSVLREHQNVWNMYNIVPQNGTTLRLSAQGNQQAPIYGHQQYQYLQSQIQSSLPVQLVQPVQQVQPVQPIFNNPTPWRIPPLFPSIATSAPMPDNGQEFPMVDTFERYMNSS